MKPLISVVVTTHDRPALLARALDSLAAQGFPDFEIVLCADEGSAGTRAIAIERLRPQDVFLCVPGLRGPAETRNLGIQVARGEWICFLDDDDSFEPTHLQDAARILVDPRCLYYFNHTVISESRDGGEVRQLGEQRIEARDGDPDAILVGNYIPNNALFVAASHARNCRFDIRLETHEDWEWLIGLKCGLDLSFTRISLWGPRVHQAEGASRNNPVNRRAVSALDYLSIYRRWRAPSDQVRANRAQVLASLGLQIPPEFL